MANSMKLKFAGLLRGLLHQLDGGDPLPSGRPVVAAAPSPKPAATSAAKNTANNFSAPPRTANADEIELPLAPVVAGLPMELRAKLMSVPATGMTICLPVETVTSQLAFGAVKISFGELRQLAPGIFANSGGELDNRLVSLPLHEILSRLNPALFARRPVQKLEVNEEISGPFDGRGRGVAFTTQPLKPASSAPTVPQPVTIPVRLTAPAAPIAFPARNIQPTPPISLSSPAKLAGNGNGNGNGHAVPPAPALKNFAAPAPAPAAAPPRPEPVQPTIFAALADLCENWPDELKNEIIRSPLASASVPLAGTAVEAGLKRGRVTMTWKQLRTLAKPSSPPSPNDNFELELPLKVIAPMFFAAQKTLQKTKAKVAVSAEIPDLFFGFPQAAPAPAPEPPPMRMAASPVQLPVVEPERKTSDTNFYVWGDNGEVPKTESEFERPAVPQTDFTHRQAHPRDVVARAAALPGVAGAVVSLPDGLCVASQVPAGLNADSLAAFLPQIFERVNQTTRELRMGALNNVNFTVGSVPWKIFRVSSVYFAAFGHAGASLPSAQLAQMAAELDRKKQQ
jgi:hypothetical protein